MTNLPATSSLAPLQNTTFRAIWIASILSNFGGMIQAVGAGWMMTSLSDSANLVALVQASTTLPVMVFSLISGASADGFDRRRIMLLAQFFMISASACLAVFAWLDLLTPWVLLGFTFLIGCGIAFTVFMAATISISVARITALDAIELKGRLIMFGTAVDSLNAASIGSTPFCLSRSHAPGLMPSRSVSRCVSRFVASAKL